jgi:hypothetical protein
MKKATSPVFFTLLAACGKVKDPTPKGTVLIEWDRSSAKAYNSKSPDNPTKHPLADAKILEGPKTRSFTVTVNDGDGKSFACDVSIDAAKVSYPEDGKDTARWATTKIVAKVRDNDAFHLRGKCDDTIGTEFGPLNESGGMAQATNTVMDCTLGGSRPNAMGNEDAINPGALLQIHGDGSIEKVADASVQVVEN